MVDVHKSELPDKAAIFDQDFHELLDQSRTHLRVNQLDLLKVVGNLIADNWHQFTERGGVERLFAVDQGLEVLHFGNAVKDD